MTTQNKIRLKQMFEAYGSVELVIAQNDFDAFTETHTDFYSCLDAINFYEIENTVYF
jgi:hypothetical protein